jgi:hypothetical protein
LVAAALFSIPASFLPDPLGKFCLSDRFAAGLSRRVCRHIKNKLVFESLCRPDFLNRKNRMKKSHWSTSSAIIDGRIAEIVRTGFTGKIGSSEFCAPGNTIYMPIQRIY